jgi:hypothetical protein
MATAYARFERVFASSVAELATQINAKAEELEASSFVLQSAKVGDIEDANGVMQKRLAELLFLHKDLLPGGGLYGLRSVAQYSVGWFRLSGVTADAQTVTIQGRVYEFDTGGAVAPGSVLVDVSGGVTAALSAVALAATVNGDSGAVVEALVDTAGTGVVLIGKAATTAFTLATTCLNGVVSGAALVDGRALAAHHFAFSEHVVTAADVTAWAAGNEVAVCGMDDPGTAPTLAHFSAADSTGGFSSLAGLAYRVARVNANNYVVLVSDTLAVLAATDVIRCGLIA